MSLIGPRKVVALHADDDHDRFIGRTISELNTQVRVLLGRVAELETDKIEAESRPNGMTARERDDVIGEWLAVWARYSAGVGITRAEYERLRDLGRGDQ